jgi:hypothetical protein
MERKIVKKWIWIWEFDKEERWLNTMAQQGWVLDKLGFCRYEFVRCEPGAYTVRLEMREHDEAYLSFMADTGAEYVGRMMKWIYFRKKTEDGPFELFSDLESRISYLDKMCRMLRGVGLANLLIGLANSINPYAALGWVNLLGATLLMYALGRIEGKKEALEKDRLLME